MPDTSEDFPPIKHRSNKIKFHFFPTNSVTCGDARSLDQSCRGVLTYGVECRDVYLACFFLRDSRYISRPFCTAGWFTKAKKMLRSRSRFCCSQSSASWRTPSLVSLRATAATKGCIF